MKRMILILSLTLILISLIPSICLAQEEEEKKVKLLEWKVRGQLIPHPDKNDVKVMTDDFQTFTFPLMKGARIEVTTRGKLEDMAKEAEGRLPKGEVTYTIIDGKPVATRISYTSGETWKMEEPKPRED